MSKPVVGDVVKMKKPHACGFNEWEITRYGADVKIKCTNCNRIVMLSRPKFLKSMKEILTKDSDKNG